MDDRELLRTVGSIIGADNCQDDCAVFPSPSGILVVSTDMLHETTDFPKGMTDWQIGWMAAAVTISDIAAMGAEPLHLLMAIGLDREERLQGIVLGSHDCCRAFGAQYSGGDLDAHQELTIVSTGIGIVRTGVPVPRSGARAGDAICITGVPGKAQAGLDGYPQYRKNLYEPQPRVGEAIKIREAGASSMMDTSDGLALSLYDLMMASHVGCRIIRGSIPVIPDIPLPRAEEYAVHGGGDFELLFTINQDLLPISGLHVTRIGTVTAGEMILIDEEKLEKKGYSHQW